MTILLPWLVFKSEVCSILCCKLEIAKIIAALIMTLLIDRRSTIIISCTIIIIIKNIDHNKYRLTLLVIVATTNFSSISCLLLLKTWFLFCWWCWVRGRVCCIVWCVVVVFLECSVHTCIHLSCVCVVCVVVVVLIFYFYGILFNTIQ